MTDTLSNLIKSQGGKIEIPNPASSSTKTNSLTICNGEIALVKVKSLYDDFDKGEQSHKDRGGIA
ncbi:10841_t:CDS:1, partial [Acaulospora colombiana]